MNNKIASISRAMLTASSAMDIVRKALDVGSEVGVAVSVWVVDHSLGKIAFASSENATPHSHLTSLKKAQTAASTRRPTGWMPAGLSIELPLASDGLLTNVPGGFPIKVDGIVVGGLGIAGGTVEQDAQIAAAVLSAFGADLS